ncbi:hypothetical protein ACFOSS_00980 [Pseudaeromonas sharmana]|uniref:Polar amino acid transport system substrate-binding protein n=1 Tax=Pseudaeromonas sharmana TaxID=328412 RepID=A0ABV8CIS4_9GAMM
MNITLPAALLAWGLLTVLTVDAKECLLHLGFNDEPIPPYIERSVPSAGPRGTAFALVDLAAHQVGCQIFWQPMPSLRVLHDAIGGEIDGALFYSWTTERARQLVFPMRHGQLDPGRRLATLNYVLYRRLGSNVQWNGVQLTPQGCAVGYNEGWSVVDYLSQFRMNAHAGKGAEALLKLLAKGRLCAYATLEEAGDAAIARQSGQFEKLSPPLLRKDYYLLFNPTYYQAHQAEVEALWSRIGALRESLATSAPGSK